MRQCTVDFDAVREGLGDRWQPYQAYTVDRARTASGKAALRVLMRDLAVPVIPQTELAGIAVRNLTDDEASDAQASDSSGADRFERAVV